MLFFLQVSLCGIQLILFNSSILVHHSICVEFTTCHSAKSPHSVWIQNLAQDLLFRQAFSQT